MMKVCKYSVMYTVFEHGVIVLLPSGVGGGERRVQNELFIFTLSLTKHFPDRGKNCRQAFIKSIH